MTDEERPDPDRPLAPEARFFWTLQLIATGIGGFVAAVVGGRLIRHNTDDGDVLHTLGTILPWAAILVAIVAATVIPRLRAQRWRWRLDDDELDLRRGVLTELRTVIPVARIQHVDIRRSLAAQIAGVAAVVVHTAAGTTEIPALSDGEAALVRDRIAGLIRTPDDA